MSETGQLWILLGLVLVGAVVLLVGLACAGLTTSLGITKLPPADPNRKFRVNFLGDLWANLRSIGADRVLTLAIFVLVFVPNPLQLVEPVLRPPVQLF